MLDKTISVFTERGYHGTSIADLATATGLTVGSIYKAFGNKYGTFIASLSRYQELRYERLTSRLSTAVTGRDQIEALLRSYAETSHGAAGLRGCLVVSSTIELSSWDPALARMSGEVMVSYERRFAAGIRRGHRDGSISRRVEANGAARALLCIVQGMRVIGKTGRSSKEMNDVVEGAMKIIS